MIHLSPTESALAALSLLTAIVVPLPAFYASKNAGFWMLSTLLFTGLVVVFCDTVVVNPFEGWCRFVERYTTISSVGSLASLVVMLRNFYVRAKNIEGSSKRGEGLAASLIDVALVVVTTAAGCLTQAFGQRDPVTIGVDDVFVRALDERKDACFPHTSDTALGIVFTDIPHLVLVAGALVYAILGFAYARRHSNAVVPHSTLLLVLTSIFALVITAYFFPLLILRAVSSSVISAYEMERRWIILVLSLAWAVVWGVGPDAQKWYALVAKDLRALIPSRPPPPPPPSDAERKIGLHTHGTLLRPSRKTWLSQYERMSIRDVSGLLAPPPPPHPALVFPNPPQKKTGKFKISLPVYNYKKKKTDAQAYAMKAVPSYSPPVPPLPPKSKSRPQAPVLVNYPFPQDPQSFLEMTRSGGDEASRPLVGRR